MGSLTLDHDVHLRRVYRQLLHLVRDRQKWRVVKAVYHQVCRAGLCLHLWRVDLGREHLEDTVSYLLPAHQWKHMDLKCET